MPAPRALLLILMLVAGAGGCGSGTRATGTATPPPVAAGKAPAPRPALCGPLRTRRLAIIRAPQARELSGLVLSRTRPGVLWTHNDSGDAPRLLAVGTGGTLLADVTVTGAKAYDWEDIAARGRRLLIGDIGDNAGARDDVVIYAVDEPAPGARVSAPATALRLRYPDGQHDAETLLADPRSSTLVIITKELSGDSGIYVARAPTPRATTTLRRVGRLTLGVGGLATGGDVSADGATIAVRTYGELLVWHRRAGESLAAALRRRPCRAEANLSVEGQGEAVALTRDGRAALTVPEGAEPVLRRYAARR